MLGNPILRLVESPVPSLIDVGWATVLLAALVATWWAAGRNLLWLDANWAQGWRYLPTFEPVSRIVALLLILALDMWLIAAIIEVVA